MNGSDERLAEKLQSLSVGQLAAVEQFIETLTSRQQEGYEARSTAFLSAPAFEFIWNNAEDEAYDAL